LPATYAAGGVTPGLRRHLEAEGSGISCAKLISLLPETEKLEAERDQLESRAEEISADSVSIHGDTATVELAGARMTLKRLADGWKVDDAKKVEKSVKGSLERSLHERIESVSCPEGQAVVVGARFNCTVTFSDAEAVASLKILNPEVDVKMTALRFRK
jgi:hypothetical protein